MSNIQLDMNASVSGMAYMVIHGNIHFWSDGGRGKGWSVMQSVNTLK